MGGKGGKTMPIPENQDIVLMQQQAAAQAKEANIERDARLQYGMSQINDIFGGHPVDAQMLDLSSLNAPPPTPDLSQVPGYSTNPGVVAGNSYWDQNTNSWQPLSSVTGHTPLAGGYSWGSLPDSGGNPQWGIFDPGGSIVTTADQPSQLANAQIWYGGDPNGPMTGGVPDNFYSDYTKSITDYYMPQEQQQYADAKSSLAYNLARAGTLNSSIAATDVGKLANQDMMNQAQIASQADIQTGSLRDQVSAAQQAAINQLYSTEDPTVAANTALNSIQNAQLQVPALNPAGAMFAPITAGVGNAISGFMNPYAYVNPTASGTSQVATANPNYGTGNTTAV
jgi:hypothetical protein